MLKNRLERDGIDPDRLERMTIWYLSRKKRYKDNRGQWLETFAFSPDLGVMLSDAFFTKLLSDEVNALTYMRDNSEWADKLYQRIAPERGHMKSVGDLLTEYLNRRKI
jgi:hypothetical protein